MVPIEQPKNHPIDKQYNSITSLITYSFNLIWDVMGGVMGVVWGVANFTALLFFFLGETLRGYGIYRACVPSLGSSL